MFLSPTQRNQVVGLIETKRKEWPVAENDGEVFIRFVKDTLAGANWPKSKSWYSFDKAIQNQIVNAGVDGTLRDLDELFTSIMKDKTQKTEP
jgi:hypothetical protein